MGILQKVKDALQGKAPITASRSPEWPKVRAAHLKANPRCALCRGTAKLEVHHIQPFHVRPELELNPKNLITLCESGSNGIICHLAFGHLGSYQSVNKTVRRDVAAWGNKIANRAKS